MNISKYEDDLKHFEFLSFFNRLKSKAVAYRDLSEHNLRGIGILTSKVGAKNDFHYKDCSESIVYLIDPLKIELSDSVTNMVSGKVVGVDFLLYNNKFEAEREYILVDNKIRGGIMNLKVLRVEEKTEEICVGAYKIKSPKFEIEPISAGQIVYPLYDSDYKRLEDYMRR